MKKIRILSIVICILAVGVFAVFHFMKLSKNDEIPPEIEMDSDSIEMSVNDSEDMILEGVTAEDEEDGDVTDSLIVENVGSFVGDSRRNATICAFDSEGNMSRVTREIVYTDYTSPHFATTTPFRFQLNTTDLLENITATDCLDGDLTSQIKMSSADMYDTSTTGKYSVELSVTNSAGDTATLPVTLTVYDPSANPGAPTITLTDYLVYVPVGTNVDVWKYVESVTVNGMTYTKAEDGNLYTADGLNVLGKDSFTFGGELDANTAGTYEKSIKITDTSSRSITIRLVIVEE